MPLFIEGSLSYRSWNDQNSQKRYETYIVIETLQLLGNRQINQQPVQTVAQPGQPPYYQSPPPQKDDDLPF